MSDPWSPRGRVSNPRRYFDRRQLRRNAPNLLIGLVVLAIVVLAITKGVQDKKVSLATIIFIGVAIPSIIFHEVSHGVVALWRGDDTAKRAGRLTADPRPHIDPIGTIILPIAMVLFNGPVFGWARPVPISLNKLKRPRNDAVLVGLAGPASNAILAAGAGAGLHFIMVANPDVGARIFFTLATLQTVGGGALYWIGTVIAFLGLANLLIGAFNLLPIPPLDGSALLERFIPVRALPDYYRIRMYLIWVVLFFVFFDRSLLSTIYGHVESWYLGQIVPVSVASQFA
ncbi:MAG: site-2 protease family protein [Acidimicrobiales bacterium]